MPKDEIIEPIDASFESVTRSMLKTDLSPVLIVKEGKAPDSPYAQWRGQIELGGAPVECYVLDTGQRVIALRAAVKSIADADSGDLAKFIGVSSLKSFIDKDLVLAELLEFTIPGTQFKGSGLSTENYELILRGYVRLIWVWH